MIRLHNTLSSKLEEFKSIEKGKVRMYHCGPTVYGPQHIGNLSMFVFTDILRRTLEYKGLDTRQVINFTDFGHLTSESDSGEDKMAKGLRDAGLEFSLENMLNLGKKYARVFLDDIGELNINTSGTLFPYASDYVADQIELIKLLDAKGFTYTVSDGVYFDTSKFPQYGKLGGLSGVDSVFRVAENPEKKNSRDFALWKFNRELGWASSWGQGFPGWHIECSAMIIKILGEQIDIHTGGIEHIPVHHNNEIAQSEAATGKEPFARFWLHRAHIQIANEKISKSRGNVILLSELKEKGFSPLAYRYLLLQSHYRTPTNFTWEALESAQNAYRKLKDYMWTLGVHINKPLQNKAEMLPENVWTPSVHDGAREDFISAIENDLNTPEALAVVWKLVKSQSVSPVDKRIALIDFDKILGLDLEHNEFETGVIPEEVR
jgi:cysteinyl-tRNA synthetase